MTWTQHAVAKAHAQQHKQLMPVDKLCIPNHVELALSASGHALQLNRIICCLPFAEQVILQTHATFLRLHCLSSDTHQTSTVEAHLPSSPEQVTWHSFTPAIVCAVFMGMGEPLLNLPSVLRAHTMLNENLGVGQRHITISTVGVPNAIMKLASHQLQSTLAISIHAPNQQLREQLVPR